MTEAKVASPRHSFKSIVALVALCVPFAWLALEWLRDLFENREHAIIGVLVALEFVAFGVWSIGSKRPHSGVASQGDTTATVGGRQQIVSRASQPIRWIPTSKQWAVIWISAVLAALMIFASVADDAPTEAIAVVIPIGLGALGVWQLETRRRG